MKVIADEDLEYEPPQPATRSSTVMEAEGSNEGSEPAVFSSAFSVTEEHTNKVVWIGGKEISTELPLYQDYDILMYGGDLDIKSTGKLIFDSEVTFVIRSEYASECSVNIEAGGSFEVPNGWDGGQSVFIKTPSTYPEKEYTYPFINRGTVDFDGADVTYTYGDKDHLSEPGGIQNRPGSTCNLNNCNVVSADTHGVYVGEGVSSSIRGGETLLHISYYHLL